MASSAHAQALVPGEILLNNQDAPNVQRYSAAGGPGKTYTGTGTAFHGVAITPTGNIVTAFQTEKGPNTGGPTGIDIFSPNGTQITSFLTPEITFPPGDVSVFADGTIAVSDQSGYILLYGQNGTLLNSLTAAGMDDPEGSAIGSDNTLWAADGEFQGLYHFTESGTLLNSFSLDFAPGDLVVDPTDGTLWITDSSNDRIVHMQALTSTTFSTLSSFDVNDVGTLNGIAISNDGKTLYEVDTASTVIQEYSRTGLTTGSITISNPNTPWFLTVVPNIAVSTSAPEPGSLALAACTALPLLSIAAVRRRRQEG